MKLDQLLTWVDRQIADYAPIDADAGELRNRFSQVLRARGDIGSGSVFGFSIPGDLRGDARTPITAKLDAALEAWRGYFTGVDGGAGYFERSLQAAGLVAPPPRAVVTDPAIAMAVADLKATLARTEAATALWRTRGWIEPDEHHAYAIAPPAADLADMLAREAARGLELPPSVEALYAELGGLWVEGDERAGEHAFDPDAAYFVFAPLETILDRADDGVMILDQHPDHFSWVMLDDTGAVVTANKLDRTPKPLAGSLVEYVQKLAVGFGRPV